MKLHFMFDDKALPVALSTRITPKHHIAVIAQLLQMMYDTKKVVSLKNACLHMEVAGLFGYVLPAKPEMRIRDFDAYRAAYCGLCKQLGKSYGVASRFLLNYDLVLVAVLTDALSGETGEVRSEGCFANPFVRRSTLHGTRGLQLAAQSLVLLSYYKLQDNLLDEKPLKRFGYRLLHPAARYMYKRAAKMDPVLAQTLAEQMRRQRVLEEAGSDNLDEACDPTAQMCAAVFATAAHNEAQQIVLQRLGLFAGQVVYLLDAAEDYDDDLQEGRYNVLHRQGLTKPEAIDLARRRCRMAAGEIALCYNLLELRQYKAVLDNIFFLGLPAGIARAGEKRNNNGGNKHGQISGV